MMVDSNHSSPPSQLLMQLRPFQLGTQVLQSCQISCHYILPSPVNFRHFWRLALSSTTQTYGVG